MSSAIVSRSLLTPELGVLSLPNGLPTETRLVVEATFGDGLILHQSLFLTGDYSVTAPEKPLHINRFGSIASSPDDKDSYIIGTIIQGTTIPDISPQELLEDLGIELFQGQLIF